MTKKKWKTKLSFCTVKYYSGMYSTFAKKFSSIQFRLNSIFYFFGASRVVSGCPSPLAPWATRPFPQWLLHWWRVNCSIAREPLPRKGGRSWHSDRSTTASVNETEPNRVLNIRQRKPRTAWPGVKAWTTLKIMTKTFYAGLEIESQNTALVAKVLPAAKWNTALGGGTYFLLRAISSKSRCFCCSSFLSLSISSSCSLMWPTCVSSTSRSRSFTSLFLLANSILHCCRKKIRGQQSWTGFPGALFEMRCLFYHLAVAKVGNTWRKKVVSHAQQAQVLLQLLTAPFRQ